MAKCLFGADNRSAESKVYVNNKLLKPNSIRAAIDAGIGYSSEDRKHDGLFQDLSISVNINLEEMLAHRGRLLSSRQDRAACESMKEKLRIKMANADLAVKALSGGNQQKVLLAKWLLIQPDVLIVDEPTRGVDIGAKSDIYQIIRELAASGMGVIVISSEMPEVMGLCSTVYVMREGQITGKLSGEEITEEAIGYLSTLG